MTNDGRSSDFRRIAFIDLEASGLGQRQLPDRGWVRDHPRGRLCGIGFMPHQTDREMDVVCKRLERRQRALNRDHQGDARPRGAATERALKRFLDAVGDRDLFSDEPEFDSHWLSMLEDAATISLGGRKLGDVKKLIEQVGVKVRPKRETVGKTDIHALTIEFGAPPRHRAEPDARSLAMAFAHTCAIVGEEAVLVASAVK